jgi:hypothetical protein
MAELLGTRYETILMTGGMASAGQEKPETINRGRPAAARMSCTRIGFRKTAATTRPSPATDSTNGTAKMRIGTMPPRRGNLGFHRRNDNIELVADLQPRKQILP